VKQDRPSCIDSGHTPFNVFLDREGRSVHIDRISGARIRARNNLQVCPPLHRCHSFDRYFEAFALPWRPKIVYETAILSPSFHIFSGNEYANKVTIFPWLKYFLVTPKVTADSCYGCIAIRLFSSASYLDLAIDEYLAFSKSQASGVDYIDIEESTRLLPYGAYDEILAISNNAEMYSRWSEDVGWERLPFIAMPGSHDSHLQEAYRLFSNMDGCEQ